VVLDRERQEPLHVPVRERRRQVEDIVDQKEEEHVAGRERDAESLEHLVFLVDAGALHTEVGDRAAQGLLQVVAHGRRLLDAVAVDHRVPEQHDIGGGAVHRVAEPHPVGLVVPAVAVEVHLALVVRPHQEHVHLGIEAKDAVGAVVVREREIVPDAVRKQRREEPEA
jgi:hypothetical protein